MKKLYVVTDDNDRSVRGHGEDNSLTRYVRGADDKTSYFEYDTSGSCTKIHSTDGTAYFAYNAMNLVSRITYPDRTIDFGYQGNLQRYAQVDSVAGTTYFVWDNLDLLETRNADGTLRARFTNGFTSIEGIGSSVEITRGSDNEKFYLLYDHRGTVYQVLDSDRLAVATRLYNAFGELVAEDESGGGWPDVIPFSYQSNWLELPALPDGSPLYLSPTRLYYPAAGRFLERDPLNELMRRVPSSPGNVLGQWELPPLNLLAAFDLDDVEFDESLRFVNVYQFALNSAPNIVDSDGAREAKYVGQKWTKVENDKTKACCLPGNPPISGTFTAPASTYAQGKSVVIFTAASTGLSTAKGNLPGGKKCCCRCCRYKHSIRGRTRKKRLANSRWGGWNYQLPGFGSIKGPQWYPEPIEKLGSEFTKKDCKQRWTDVPGIRTGGYFHIEFDFLYEVVDACQGKNLGAVADLRANLRGIGKMKFNRRLRGWEMINGNRGGAFIFEELGHMELMGGSQNLMQPVWPIEPHPVSGPGFSLGRVVSGENVIPEAGQMSQSDFDRMMNQ